MENWRVLTAAEQVAGCLVRRRPGGFCERMGLVRKDQSVEEAGRTEFGSFPPDLVTSGSEVDKIGVEEALLERSVGVLEFPGDVDMDDPLAVRQSRELGVDLVDSQIERYPVGVFRAWR